MELDDRLDSVLAAARGTAREVDAECRFPVEAVTELRKSGLLGLTLPVDVGGLGCGPGELVHVVSSLAGACGSTAMVYLMHLTAAMNVAAAPPTGLPNLVSTLAHGEAVASLAFSEAGSRSHFWAPLSRLTQSADGIRLTARKSWVTSAGHADVYVVSTLCAEGEGIDIYAVPATTPGIEVAGDWHGMGLRGNASNPISFDVRLPESYRLGEAGGGLSLMLETVLPWFNLGNASVSLGLAGAALDATVRHTRGARLEHLHQSLAALPTVRAQLAKASLDLETTRAYARSAADRMAQPTEDTVLHVLGVKAAANDAALRITDAAMRMCGGAAFSAHLEIDRFFRDARAGSVMAPTADVLYDLYAKALTGQDLL